MSEPTSDTPPPRPVWQWYRHCPGCGSPATNLGAVPFRCDHCGFANFFGPVSAVGGLIIDDDDRLLMVRRARDPGKGKWGLPGGFVDPGESIEGALAREVREEVGLKLDWFRYLMSGPNDYDYRGIVAPVIDVFFLAHAVDTDAVQLERGELRSFEWVADPTGNLDDMAFESNRIAIERWMETRR